jgi:hypothetical protein
MRDTRARDAGLEPEFWTAEGELKARLRQQEATGRLGLAALTGVSLAGLMDEAVNLVAGVLAVEYCKILEIVPDGATLFLRAVVGWKEGLVGRATVGTNLQSQAGYALISAEPVVVEDLRTENRFEDTALLREHGVVSGLSTTIRVGGHAYGVLSAHQEQKAVHGGRNPVPAGGLRGSRRGDRAQTREARQGEPPRRKHRVGRRRRETFLLPG